jgi:hypothetical protein
VLLRYTQDKAQGDSDGCSNPFPDTYSAFFQPACFAHDVNCDAPFQLAAAIPLSVGARNIEVEATAVGGNQIFKKSFPNQLAPNTKIQVFIRGYGTTKDDVFSTTVAGDFTGEVCFKAYGTFANPQGSPCN